MNPPEPPESLLVCENCGYRVKSLHRCVIEKEELGICDFCFNATPGAWDEERGVIWAPGFEPPPPRDFDWKE